MRVSPLRCWALFAATAAAGALAQAVPPSTTLPNSVPLPAAKPGAIRPPGTTPNGASAVGRTPNGTAVPGKLPDGKSSDGAPLLGTLPDGTPLPGKLPPPPERPPGWLPRTTAQEGPELNAVPAPLAGGGEMRREPHVVETTPTLDAAGTANELMSVAVDAGELADAVSGGHYEKPLEKFGKVLEGVDLAIKLGGGIYRDGGTGLARATEELWEEAKTTAVIEFGAGVAAGMAGHAAAPVAAAATAGWGIGSAIDSVAGDAIFRNGVGMVQDVGYDIYDRVVREPQREEMGRRLREKHQRTKAENAMRATLAAQAAQAAQAAEAAQLAARQEAAVNAAANASPPGPSAVELILKTVVDVQQAKLNARAAAQQPASGSSAPDSGGGCGGNGPGTCR